MTYFLPATFGVISDIIKVNDPRVNQGVDLNWIKYSDISVSSDKIILTYKNVEHVVRVGDTLINGHYYNYIYLPINNNNRVVYSEFLISCLKDSAFTNTLMEFFEQRILVPVIPHCGLFAPVYIDWENPDEHGYCYAQAERIYAGQLNYTVTGPYGFCYVNKNNIGAEIKKMAQSFLIEASKGVDYDKINPNSPYDAFCLRYTGKSATFINSISNITQPKL